MSERTKLLKNKEGKLLEYTRKLQQKNTLPLTPLAPQKPTEQYSSRSVNATWRQEGTQKHSPQLLAPPRSTHRRLFLKHVHVYTPTSAQSLTDAAATAAATRQLRPGAEPGALGLPHLTKASLALTLTTSMLSPVPGAGVPLGQSPEANAANASVLPSGQGRGGWTRLTPRVRSYREPRSLAAIVPGTEQTGSRQRWLH